MANKILTKLQDLSSFNYNKIKQTSTPPNNVKNLPAPPARVTEITTTNVSEDYSKLTNMSRGSNDVKQPSDFYLNAHRFNDGIGNIGLQVIKTAEDVERWAKWTITPKGLLFNIKQGILQRFNAQKNTRIYNPLGLLASVPPYVHAPRHTNNTFIDLDNPPKYDKESEVMDNNPMDNANVTPEASGLNESIGNLFYQLAGPKKAKDYGFKEGPIKVGTGDNLYDVTVHNTLQVPYGGQLNRTGTTKLPKDFIKFRIRDLVNGKWLIFPAYIGTITDTITPEWTSERYIGRPDSVHVYTGTERSIGMDFKVAAFTKQEIPIIQEKMNYLVGLGYPSYKSLFEGDSEKRPVAPYINLTIGDLFKDTPGFFNSITITMEENTTWELDEGFQIPQVFNVSCEFTYIGKYLPQTLGKHYEVPFLPEVHDVKSGISPYSDQTKKTPSTAYNKTRPFHAQMHAKVGQNSMEKSE